MRRWARSSTSWTFPRTWLEKAQTYREQMIEAVSEFDDVLFEKFIHGEALTNDEIRAGIRKATIGLKIFPVICGSAFKNKGVQTMMDAVVDYLPSPLDIPPVKGLDRRPSGNHGQPRKPRDNEPFAALVFKIMTDPYSGQLAFFRVYSGKMTAGESVFNVAKGRKERVGPPDAHARQQARRHQRDPGGRHLRRGGSAHDFDRRHDLR